MLSAHITCDIKRVNDESGDRFVVAIGNVSIETENVPNLLRQLADAMLEAELRNRAQYPERSDGEVIGALPPPIPVPAMRNDNHPIMVEAEPALQWKRAGIGSRTYVARAPGGRTLRVRLEDSEWTAEIDGHLLGKVPKKRQAQALCEAELIGK